MFLWYASPSGMVHEIASRTPMVVHRFESDGSSSPNLNTMLVYRSSGRKVRKSLSIDEKLIAKYTQLGYTYREAVQQYRWLMTRIELTKIEKQLA